MRKEREKKKQVSGVATANSLITASKHMQVCTLLQTDNHVSTPHLYILMIQIQKQLPGEPIFYEFNFYPFKLW